MKKAIVAPIILAIKSIQSPLLLPFVQCACSISIKPPIATGINHTQIICPNFMSLWHFIYSNKIIEHVPPYIMICVHLSASLNVCTGVCLLNKAREGRDQHRREDRDDRNNDHKLNDCEALFVTFAHDFSPF